MRNKWLIYLLLFVQLFSFVELRQFLRFPFLVEHFSSHSNDPQTIWTPIKTFFVEHYIFPRHFDTDDTDDNQLPFRSIPIYLSSSVSPIHLIINSMNLFFESNQGTFIGYFKQSEQREFSLISEIWHPPNEKSFLI